MTAALNLMKDDVILYVGKPFPLQMGSRTQVIDTSVTNDNICAVCGSKRPNTGKQSGRRVVILRSKDYLIKHCTACGLASGTVAAKTGSGEVSLTF